MVIFAISSSQLDCCVFTVGTLNVEDLHMQARNLSSSSVEVQWNEIESVLGYVLVVDNKIRKPKTISVEGASTTSYQINNLRAGHLFKVGGNLFVCLFLFFSLKNCISTSIYFII